MVVLLVLELIKFPKRGGGNAVIGLGICACLVTGLEHTRSLLPSAERKMLKLARPPAIHTGRGVGLGAGSLLHELGSGGRTDRSAWLSVQVTLEVLPKFLKVRRIVLVSVVNWLPRLSEETVGFVDVGGVSVVGGVVVHRCVRTMVILDVAVVVFYGTFFGVIFVFLFHVPFVCFLELDDVVVEVVGVRHVRGLDVVVVRNLADFIVHVSGVVVMLLQLRLCKSGVVCGVVASERSGRKSV